MDLQDLREFEFAERFVVGPHDRDWLDWLVRRDLFLPSMM